MVGPWGEQGRESSRRHTVTTATTSIPSVRVMRETRQRLLGYRSHLAADAVVASRVDIRKSPRPVFSTPLRVRAAVAARPRSNAMSSTRRQPTSCVPIGFELLRQGTTLSRPGDSRRFRQGTWPIQFCRGFRRRGGQHVSIEPCGRSVEQGRLLAGDRRLEFLLSWPSLSICGVVAGSTALPGYRSVPMSPC